MFLHASWLHVLGNTLFLYVFGNNVEDRMGRLRYLLVRPALGYAAAYGFALIFPNSQTALIGASGAIAGILGAYLLLWPRARVWSLVPFLLFIPLRLPAWFVLGSAFCCSGRYAATGQSGARRRRPAYVAHVSSDFSSESLPGYRALSRPRPVGIRRPQSTRMPSPARVGMRSRRLLLM